MGMAFDYNPEYHQRPGVFIWSPEAYKERREVQTRRDEAHNSFLRSKVSTSCLKYKQGSEKSAAWSPGQGPCRHALLAMLARY